MPFARVIPPESLAGLGRSGRRHAWGNRGRPPPAAWGRAVSCGRSQGSVVGERSRRGRKPPHSPGPRRAKPRTAACGSRGPSGAAERLWPRVARGAGGRRRLRRGRRAWLIKKVSIELASSPTRGAEVSSAPKSCLWVPPGRDPRTCQRRGHRRAQRRRNEGLGAWGGGVRRAAPTATVALARPVASSRTPESWHLSALLCTVGAGRGGFRSAFGSDRQGRARVSGHSREPRTGH